MEIAVDEFAKYGILGMGWVLFFWMFLRNSALQDKYIDLAIKVGISYEGMKAIVEKLGKP